MEPTLRQLFSLEGKVALVTGGAGVLGSAMCRALAQAGARVAVASRNLDHCQHLAEALGPAHFAVAIDLASEASVRAGIDQVVAHAGRLDVLVNNGYRGPTPRQDEATAVEFDYSLTVGVTGQFVAAQQAARHMRANGGGSIINVASMYGLVASYPEVYEGLEYTSPPNYHAVKGALIQLTRHLAAYWARDGIRVNCLSPGAFPHAPLRQQSPEFIRRLEERVPLKRVGEPHELMGAVVFLASEASSYCTGHNLVVDGGWTIW
ncbi:MAG: SDR family oxidoreductase [Armatimonadetes bacterium]|nr:SDR family oxidoreductase [Armatimonadota bacterium]